MEKYSYRINRIEFRDNKLPTLHPEHEIVCWSEDNKHCWTVAIFRKHREGYFLESVLDRIIDVDKDDLFLVMRNAFGYLNLKYGEDE